MGVFTEVSARFRVSFLNVFWTLVSRLDVEELVDGEDNTGTRWGLWLADKVICELSGCTFRGGTVFPEGALADAWCLSANIQGNGTLVLRTREVR